MTDHLTQNLEWQLLQRCTGAAHRVTGEEDLNLVGTKILRLFPNLHLDFSLPGELIFFSFLLDLRIKLNSN
jgi:hypothetical protein